MAVPQKALLLPEHRMAMQHAHANAGLPVPEERGGFILTLSSPRELSKPLSVSALLNEKNAPIRTSKPGN